MTFFKYNGFAHAIKIPTNAPGDSPRRGDPKDIQNFLIWTLLPAGDVIVEIDETLYPHAISHIQALAEKQSAQKLLLPLWEYSLGPATIAPPDNHRPNLPSAIF